ncbi:peptidyl-tRNA hydrolase [Aaosphaeria arxii CBS 175.79]|uniref:peptidyl-tRNA hydrolase n=1 Tax=Aaosphaeria arxii CBS 175.79 TaxID=1450172 RepID=A0A6A5XJG4_9PLEO|nr:peptidyl-tRNA hydrolase [Aaosphaeria arxii CBS 175.79]KAF2012890.1 peptidyl-tRNA hydrolase [Aaosphaeria arxii CBS 175.79]
MDENAQTRAHVADPASIANRDFADQEILLANCPPLSHFREDQQIVVTDRSLKSKKHGSINHRTGSSGLNESCTFHRSELESYSRHKSSQKSSKRKPDNVPLSLSLGSRVSGASIELSAINTPLCISNNSTTPNPDIFPPMPPTQFYPLLVCSLGNPGKQYANTLHSAGHNVIEVIRARGQYLPFQKGMSGLVSTPNMTRAKIHLIWGAVKEKQAELAPGEDDFTLWQSTKLMNVSGPSVRSAWTTFLAQQKSKGHNARLVILHDELESKLGHVTIRQGVASPKGHNGIKSCQASLRDTEFWRIGVGIGRPESRDPAVVSKYVLGKMTVREEQAMQDASFHVLKALRLIAEGNA